MVSYTNNTPQATQTIAQTQPLILNNFAFLENSIGAEHNFNAAGTGTDTYHLQASMPNLGGAPALPVGTNGMYYVEGGNARFWDGTNISRLTEASVADNGYQWIGRVLVQWGLKTQSASNQTVTFPIAFPTAVFNIQLTPWRNSSSISGDFGGFWINSTTIGLGGFTLINNSSNSFGYYWQAIGH